MKTLAIGAPERIEELKLCLPENVELETAEGPFQLDSLEGFDLIFDLQADDEEYDLDPFIGLENTVVFASAVKRQLAEMVDPDEEYPPIIGINALPGFLNRPLKEVSILDDAHKDACNEILETLEWEHQWVDDRVGMVTPRIIFMIINEACYTVQEGTATMQDIDSSMKLGTAYPKGPFEWSDEIGITDVYETLEAIYLDTGDERYKICPLLKTHYLKQMPFLDVQ